MQKLKVIISGGGTGGHIFPAIAVANALKKKVQDVEILFVGAQDRMEMEKVPAAGFAIEGLWISGLQRRLTLKNLMFPFKLISSLLKAKSIVKKFQPNVVAGFGGFASGPLLQMALRSGVPGIIQEQNSYPGITNKLLASKVSKICVAYDGMDRFFPKEKILLTGNPVRRDIIDVSGKRDRGLEHFNLPNDKKIVLVVGGSLGAKTINESIALHIDLFKEKNICVLWQTGTSYFETAEQIVLADGASHVRAHKFIAKMDLAYAVADIVISRAGAMSVSELCITGKPCILVPSPNVAEDHQTKNAMALVNHGAAVLVKDIDAKEKLGEALSAILDDNEKLESLKMNIAGLAHADSAEIIANEIINLAQHAA